MKGAELGLYLNNPPCKRDVELLNCNLKSNRN